MAVAKHLVVNALAGTGKTTTLVEGLGRMLERKKTLTGSDQQEAIWSDMLTGRRPNSVQFCAFNKAIATELGARMPAGATASTMHSMGFSAIRKAASGRVKVDQWKVYNTVEELLQVDGRELKNKKPEFMNNIKSLVGLCKQTLIEPDPDGLAELISHYGIAVNGEFEELCAVVPNVLDACKEELNVIDFNDMIWLPVVLNMNLFKNDLLLIDESQDLNRCQQQLALRSGKRLVLVGDVNQAIYGFAGADVESMGRMIDTLNDTDRECNTYPLTQTRRCGRAIVAEAQKIVPEFEAHESNCAGTVLHRELSDAMLDEFDNSDMVICRTNAPLANLCYRLISKGVKATIRGRDIGVGLISTIKKVGGEDVSQMLGKLDEYYMLEAGRIKKRKNYSDAALIGLEDKVKCIRTLGEGSVELTDLTKKIETIFTDKVSGVVLSSIHKAKGLEANRVYILQPELLPHPMAKSQWQKKQESHLLYVGVTRSITELVFLS